MADEGFKRKLPGLKKLADEVHLNDGKIAFQLAHGGRQVPKKLIGLPPLWYSKNLSLSLHNAILERRSDESYWH